MMFGKFNRSGVSNIKQMGVRMVQTYNFHEKSNNILEAKTFLVIRALQRVFQNWGGDLDNREFDRALEKEFQFSNIKYQRKPPVMQISRGMTASLKSESSFLCMSSLAVQIKYNQPISDQDCQNLSAALGQAKLPSGLIINYHHGGMEIQHVTTQRSELD